MIVIVYVVTIIAFSIAAMLLPALYLTLLAIYRSAVQKPAPPNRTSAWPSVISAILLMILTRYMWQMLGYDTGWVLIGILAVINFFCGGAYGANEGNQTNSYGTMFGLILYGIFYR